MRHPKTRKVRGMRSSVALSAMVALAVSACAATPVNRSETSGNPYQDIPGQIPKSAIENLKGQDYAPVGACVKLSGVERKSNFSLVDCSSSDVNYRIIQRVNWPTECVKDADRIFYHNDRQGYEWVACMDLAWSPNYCLSVTPKLVKQVQCGDTTAVNRQRPIRLVTNSVTVDDCPSEGFAHPVRRFTICTETQK